MGLIEEILVRPKLRQKLWAWWYPFFTRRVRAQGIDFLNYAFHEDGAPPLLLAAGDELNRPNICLLYTSPSPRDRSDNVGWRRRGG
jgi:hypothetical protein